MIVFKTPRKSPRTFHHFEAEGIRNNLIDHFALLIPWKFFFELKIKSNHNSSFYSNMRSWSFTFCLFCLKAKRMGWDLQRRQKWVCSMYIFIFVDCVLSILKYNWSQTWHNFFKNLIFSPLILCPIKKIFLVTLSLKFESNRKVPHW